MSVRDLCPAGRFLLLSCCCIFLSAAGCGTPEPAVVPVSGTVTVGGAPMTFGVVNYVPDAAKGNTGGRAASGNLGEGGAYKLSTGVRDGAIPGWYKVTVVAGGPTGTPPANAVSPDAKYSDAAKTDLSVEVKPQAAAGAYDLKLTK